MISPAASKSAPPGLPAKTLLAVLLVTLASLAAAWWVTAGFRAVTTEDARRLAVATQPQPIPDALVQYEAGSPQSLTQALRADGRIAIVAFIYTRCNTICSIMGNEYQQLQQTIRERGLGDRVRLLSVSFDPRDTQQELASYAARLQARADGWRFARVVDQAQLPPLLDAFGITVVPAPLGEFQHNAAFHIVTPDGRLVRIVDFDQSDAALAQALTAAEAMKLAQHAQQGKAS
jgi:protein SCO1/2